MKEQTFLKLLNLISKTIRDAEKLEELGVDLCESVFVHGVYDLLDVIIEDVYGKVGLEWVQWWIYEKLRNPSLKAYETLDNGEQVEIIRTEKELYEYLEHNCKQD